MAIDFSRENELPARSDAFSRLGNGKSEVGNAISSRSNAFSSRENALERLGIVLNDKDF